MRRAVVRYLVMILISLSVLSTSGCTSFLPSAGPSRAAVVHADPVKIPGLEIIDVTSDLTRDILSRGKKQTFASMFEDCRNGGQRIGPGDVLSIHIWETPPATLFANATQVVASIQPQTGNSPTRIPEQQVSNDGTITVPFAGSVRVAGLTLKQAGNLIHERLKGKANDPQIMVLLDKNVSSTVTVVGEVDHSCLVALTPKCERLLDVLASAGGVKQQVGKLVVQLTRGDKVCAVPLDNVIRDRRENIFVEPGDVVTVLYQPLSFTTLGVANRNAEIEFEAKGITLAQALARSGGVNDNVADAQGVFIFRYELVDAVPWPHKPTMITPDNKVPVIYKINLRDPATLFAAQAFPIKDKDLLYVATAPSVQLVKFLQIIASMTNPIISTTSNVKTISQ